MEIAVDLAGWRAMLYAAHEKVIPIVARFHERYGGPPFTFSPNGHEPRHVFVALGDMPDMTHLVPHLPGAVQREWPRFQHFWSLAYQYREQYQDPRFLRRVFAFNWSPPDNTALSLHALIIWEREQVPYNPVWHYCNNLATWWHVQHQGVMAHAAAVARTPDAGYLFLGNSEAGKSTTARLSAEIGLTSLSDDLVYVIPDAEHGFRLAAMSSSRVSPVGYAGIRPPLRGIFHLVQDTTDYLEPLSQRQTARLLYDGLMQTPAMPILPPAMIGNAFRTVSAITRMVPGYTLHFRKSPDFWQVIDAEFGHD